MKTLLFSFLLLGSVVLSWAATSINVANKYAFGANLGWMDWRGETNSGAVIGEYVCSGFIWAANVGWIHLGSNAPANGIRYQNNSATDYGVNHDGQGNLRGYAYGANIGWLNFETNGAPRVDLKTGKLSGHAYSANCGWISLSNAFAHVQTDSITTTDTDGDGIADAWERTYTNTLTAFTAVSDTDADGVSDKNEYFADTNPKDPNDKLRITSITRGVLGTNFTVLNWPGKPTRCYAIQYRTNLDVGTPWLDYAAPAVGVGSAGFNDSYFRDFYRVRAFRPLSP